MTRSYGRLDVVELQRWRDEGRRFTLLDVREDDEVAIVALPGAVHLPIGEIAQRIGELDRGTPIAVMCHLGGRSAKVAQFLGGQGFPHVYNVEGGIDEFAERVDPALARY